MKNYNRLRVKLINDCLQLHQFLTSVFTYLAFFTLILEILYINSIHSLRRVNVKVVYTDVVCIHGHTDKFSTKRLYFRPKILSDDQNLVKDRVWKKWKLVSKTADMLSISANQPHPQTISTNNVLYHPFFYIIIMNYGSKIFYIRFSSHFVFAYTNWRICKLYLSSIFWLPIKFNRCKKILQY